jgi:hypothetical protein
VNNASDYRKAGRAEYLAEIDAFSLVPVGGGNRTGKRSMISSTHEGKQFFLQVETLSQVCSLFIGFSGVRLRGHLAGGQIQFASLSTMPVRKPENLGKLKEQSYARSYKQKNI